MPEVRSLYETVLYAQDVATATGFYTDILGFTVVRDSGVLGRAIRLPDGAMLLIFDPRESAQPGREVPSHGAKGAGHVAFRIDREDYRRWRDHLEDCGVQIEHEHTWSTGARSIYIRDPAGNSVELVDGELWPMTP